MEREAGGITANDWQKAVAGSLNLGFLINEKAIEFEREHLLASEPGRMGFMLVIKRTSDEIKNPIAYQLKWHNIIVCVPPDEELSVEKLWKFTGFAGIYEESLSPKVPSDEITVTVICDKFPESLINDTLAESQTDNRESGIYVIKNRVLPCINIVVLSELEDGATGPVKLLSDSPSEGDVRKFLIEAKNYKDEDVKEDVLAVLNVSAERNKSLYKKLIEEDVMCDALREIMSEELAREHKEGVSEGFKKGRTLGKTEGKNEGQKALISVIRDMKEGASEAEILSQGYELNTLSLAKSVL